MELREQKYVLAIAKYKNISKAAKEIHISQPALSSFLSKIEYELGVCLFERSDRNFFLTPAGQLYVEKAKQMMQIKHEFDLSLRQFVSDYPVSITIGLQSLRAPRLVPKLSIAIMNNFPNIKFTIIDDTGLPLLNMLKKNEIDLALCNYLGYNPDFISYTLREDTLLLVTSNSHEIPHITPQGDKPYGTADLNQLQNENFILLPSSHTLRRTVDSIIEQNKIEISNTQEVCRQESALHFASLNYGITFTLDSYLSLFDLPQPVNYYYIKQFNRPINYNVFFVKNNFPPKFISSFVKVLKLSI